MRMHRLQHSRIVLVVLMALAVSALTMEAAAPHSAVAHAQAHQTQRAYVTCSKTQWKTIKQKGPLVTSSSSPWQGTVTAQLFGLFDATNASVFCGAINATAIDTEFDPASTTCSTLVGTDLFISSQGGGAGQGALACGQSAASSSPGHSIPAGATVRFDAFQCTAASTACIKASISWVAP